MRELYEAPTLVIYETMDRATFNPFRHGGKFLYMSTSEGEYVRRNVCDILRPGNISA